MSLPGWMFPLGMCLLAVWPHAQVPAALALLSCLSQVAAFQIKIVTHRLTGGRRRAHAYQLRWQADKTSFSPFSASFCRITWRGLLQVSELVL